MLSTGASNCARYAITMSKPPRLSAPERTWRAPRYNAAAIPVAIVMPTSTIEHALRPGQPDLAACRAVRLLDKALLLALLLAERFHDPQRPEHLLHNRHRRALVPADVFPLLAQASPAEPRDAEERRHDGGGDDGKGPIEPGGHDQHGHQCEDRCDERHEAIHREILDRLRIVLNAVGRVGAPPAVVVGERQALDVREKQRAKLKQEFLDRCRSAAPSSTAPEAG